MSRIALLLIITVCAVAAGLIIYGLADNKPEAEQEGLKLVETAAEAVI